MKTIHILYEFSIIIFLWLLGVVFEKLLYIPLPATIISMLLLIFCLFFRLIPLEKIEHVSTFLLEYITLFMTPLAIGIIDKLDYFKGQWFVLSFILLISVLVSMIVTAYATLWCMRLFSKKKGIQ